METGVYCSKKQQFPFCTGIQIPRPCHLQIYGNSTIPKELIAAVGLQLSACPVNPYITKGKGYIEVLAHLSTPPIPVSPLTGVT